MIKAILYDLDGVLLPAKHIHFIALNKALEQTGFSPIKELDHTTKFDGLSTKQKLSLLSITDPVLQTTINNLKQEHTLELIEQQTKEDPHLFNTILTLKKRGFKLGCCSNAVRATVELVLKKRNILQFMDVVLSNEDVLYPKPSGEIYTKAVNMLGLIPGEVVVFEDNPKGVQAGVSAGCVVRKVNERYPYEITLPETDLFLGLVEQPVNVVIPMAGQGQRFKDQGYQEPKPFIPVRVGLKDSISMIESVLKNLHFPGVRFTLLVQHQHLAESADSFRRLNGAFPGRVAVVPVFGKTEGAACTVLQAKEAINNDTRLVIANSDQLVKGFSLRDMIIESDSKKHQQGSILVFEEQDRNPKWSFAALNEKEEVVRTVEKEPISPWATVGVYYFRHGSSFVQAAEQMITENARSKGEFYVCPVYNWIINNNSNTKIGCYKIQQEQMCGLGTPEDLERFIKQHAHYSSSWEHFRS